MPMMFNNSPMSIPYTMTVGQSVTFTFDDAMAMSGFKPTPGLMDQSRFTGGYVHWLNDTDFTLYGTYDTSNDMCVLTPGMDHYCPLNAENRAIVWLIVGKNTFQQHPQAQLHGQYLDRADMQSGHQVTAGGGTVNPSTVAAGIGPGTLPPGVLIPAAQVLAGTFHDNAQYNFQNRLDALQFTSESTTVGTFVSNAPTATTPNGIPHWFTNASGDGMEVISSADNTYVWNYGGSNTGPNGPGAWLFDGKNNAFIYRQATSSGITFTGAVAASPPTVSGNAFVANVNGNGGNPVVMNILDAVSGAINWLFIKIQHANGDALTFWDNTHGVNSFTINPNNGGAVDNAGNFFARLASNGGGGAGAIAWVGTTDPGTNAREGDLWFSA